ncbi:dihydroxyacetone kinase subunit DhaK [Bombilactobacillus bombi]|uniref:Dihydroxyacetone kinase subunit DhaK n=1 Tax=Bombilactobacillus bombi TaxID=1303590 RepID=A0A3R7CKY9_9LACO|nr:dihydroxyacetone kinase subunit DhaK [Bombilactobacillus bombi]RHW46923.1 dihydroxyacetone kinase subunit DhaK [Bombilactobacillus bombi]
MKKIINQVSEIVPEMVQGIVQSSNGLLRKLPDTQVVIRNDEQFQTKIQVGLVSGGGSGHEPLHAGFVGEGMLTAAVCGEIFTSPTPDQILAAIKEADQGQGVLLIVKNYSGDVMNFDMAKEMAQADNIKVESIIVDDDISIPDSQQGRRGVAGTVLVEKILGAAARQGCTLEQLQQLGQQVIDNTKTLGIALQAATVPAVGHPGFELANDEIEYGVGIHNERGYSTEKLQSAQKLAQELLTKILAEFDANKNDEFAVLVNGMGATPLMEQYIFLNNVLEELQKQGIKVTFTKVGNLVTSIDMSGLSLTLVKLDNGWQDYLTQNVTTLGW